MLDESLLKKLVSEYQETRDERVFNSILEFAKPLIEDASLRRFNGTPPNIDFDTIEGSAMAGIFDYAYTQNITKVSVGTLVSCIDGSIIGELRRAHDFRSEKGRFFSRNISIYGEEGKLAWIDLIPSTIETPGVIYQNNETAERLANIIYNNSSLSGIEREIIYLRYGRSLLQSEIAKRISLSRNTVISKLKLINEKLIPKLKKLNGKFDPKSFIIAIKKRYESIESIKTLDSSQWENLGRILGYDKINPQRLQESINSKERAWVYKGYREGWTPNFNFSRIKEKSPFKSYEHWKSYGIVNKYHKRNIKSLEDSEYKGERSWFSKGYYNGWVKKFEFARKREKSQFQNIQSWIDYGLDYGFDNRIITSLQFSDEKEERSWFNKGHYERWTKNFEFERTSL